MLIWIGDNYYIVRDKYELKELLVNILKSPDIGIAVQKLIDEANYTERKIDTDLCAYEYELDEMHSSLNETLDITDEAIEYVSNAKRINRKHLLALLEEIKK